MHVWSRPTPVRRSVQDCAISAYLAEGCPVQLFGAQPAWNAPRDRGTEHRPARPQDPNAELVDSARRPAAQLDLTEIVSRMASFGCCPDRAPQNWPGNWSCT